MNDETHIHPMTTRWAHWTVVAIVTAAGAIWLLHTGPVPVIRITTPLEETAPFWYMLSPFPILGMLVAELVGIIATSGVHRRAIELACALAVLVLVSHFRLAIRLPLSGHSFLLSYFICRRALLSHPRLRSHRTELWIAGGMFLAMSYVKLTWWTDPITLSVGAITGAALFWLSRIAISGRTGTQTMESAQPARRPVR